MVNIHASLIELRKLIKATADLNKSKHDLRKVESSSNDGAESSSSSKKAKMLAKKKAAKKLKQMQRRVDIDSAQHDRLLRNLAAMPSIQVSTKDEMKALLKLKKHTGWKGWVVIHDNVKDTVASVIRSLGVAEGLQVSG